MPPSVGPGTLSVMNHQAAETPRRKQWGRLLVLSAAILWSTSGLFAKSPLLDQWPQEVRGTLLAFWRALFAGLVLVPFVRRPRWTWKLAPALLIFAVMNVTYLTAMVTTTAANAVWLQYTAPLWVFLANVIWLRDPVVWQDRLMLAFGMLGVGTILCFELLQTDATHAGHAGVFWGLASGITFAGVIVSLRVLRDQDAAWLMALNLLVTAALLAPLVAYHGIWPDGGQLLWLAAFGAFQMGIPYLLFAYGVRWIVGHEASCIALLEPVLVPVWVYLAWHNWPSYQAPAWWTLVGGAFILTGLLLRYRRHW